MPREIVHWDILHRAIERLPKASCRDLSNIAREHPACLALGAIAHDAPYYRHGGGSSFEWIGSLLHGLGGTREDHDTLRLLSVFGAKASSISDSSTRAASLAFLMGLISHYATDVVFHPAIFFFTGDYYAIDPKQREVARAKHRLFEVFLDEDRLTRIETLPWSTSLRALLHSVPPHVLETICSALSEAVTPAVLSHGAPLVSTLTNEWRSSLKDIARFQSLFVSEFWGRIAQVLKHLSFGHLHQFEVLFARGRRGSHATLHEPWSYRNPVTGDSETASMDEMDERAIALTLSLLNLVQAALKAGGVTSTTLLGGVSLNYGIKGSIAEDATYFSACGFNLPSLWSESSYPRN